MAPTETLAEQHFATLQALMPGAARARRRCSPARRPPRAARDILGKLAQRRAEHPRRHARADRGRRASSPPRRRGRRRAAPLRRAPARRARRQGARRALAPHVLHMTATPIPRTLRAGRASARSTSPRCASCRAGRQPIETLRRVRRARARAGLRAHPRGAARRAPGVRRLPAGRASPRRCRRARRRPSTSACGDGEFADFRVVLLHGQMQPAREGRGDGARSPRASADVLVATTVIEVGIDVPNATVMLVEDAERYGISPAAPAARPRRARRARLAVPAVRARRSRARLQGAGRAPRRLPRWPRSTSSCAARAS